MFFANSISGDYFKTFCEIFANFHHKHLTDCYSKKLIRENIHSSLPRITPEKNYSKALFILKVLVISEITLLFI